MGVHQRAWHQHETGGFRTMTQPRIVTWNEKSSSKSSKRPWIRCLSDFTNECGTSPFYNSREHTSRAALTKRLAELGDRRCRRLGQFSAWRFRGSTRNSEKRV